MTVQRMIFFSAVMAVLFSLQACAPPPPPPRDARGISEREFKHGDTPPANTKAPAAVGGGGTSLKKHQW